MGHTPAAEGGYLSNPILSNTGPGLEADFNNVVELASGRPVNGRFLTLARTGTEDPEDFQLRVDEVYLYECTGVEAGLIRDWKNISTVFHLLYVRRFDVVKAF